MSWLTAYKLKIIAILNVKEVDFRCILWGVSRDEAVNRLKNSVLEDKYVLQIDFGANKTPVDVIKEDAFEEYILETFILVLMESCAESHGKLFLSVKISYSCSYFWGDSSEIHFLREQF